MNTEKFIRNIIDQVKELQLKLGYVREAVRLYYPASSLRLLLETEGKSAAELVRLMSGEPAFTEGRLGRLEFSADRERIEVRIPPEGVQYVHESVETPGFLKDIIEYFQTHHHGTIQEICRVFQAHGAYRCEKMPEGSDFDYAVSFQDSSVDEYYYCIREEMDHTIYHRFTREDYRLLNEGGSAV